MNNPILAYQVVLYCAKYAKDRPGKLPTGWIISGYPAWLIVSKGNHFLLQLNWSSYMAQRLGHSCHNKSKAWQMLHMHADNDPKCFRRSLWRDHVNNQVLYADLPWVSLKIRTHHHRMAGHCMWHDDLAVSNIVLWEPAHGEASQGWQLLTFVDQLRWATGLDSVVKIKSCMEDHKIWQAIVVQGVPNRWWWWWHRSPRWTHWQRMNNQREQRWLTLQYKVMAKLWSTTINT